MKLEGNLLFFQAPFVMSGVLLRFHQLDIMYEQRLGFFASPGVLAYILFPNTMQVVSSRGNSLTGSMMSLWLYHKHQLACKSFLVSLLPSLTVCLLAVRPLGNPLVAPQRWTNTEGLVGLSVAHINTLLYTPSTGYYNPKVAVSSLFVKLFPCQVDISRWCILFPSYVFDFSWMQFHHPC